MLNEGDEEMEYISYDWYKAFYMVVKNGSITAAAEAMKLTQPTVTHSIQKLEEALSSKLLIRGKKGVILTDEGHIIYQYIENACENIMRSEKELVKYKNRESGELVVGANETTLHHFLLPYISAYQRQYPQISIRIENNVSPEIIRHLQNGKIDCAVIFFSAEYKKEEIVIKDLAQIPYCIIAGKNIRELLNGKKELKELEKYSLVGLAENTVSGQAHRKFFEDNNLNYKPRITVATADLVVPTVISTGGIGIVPRPFAEEKIQSGDIFEVKTAQKIPDRPICLICSNNAVNKPAVLALIEMFEMHRGSI